MDPQHWATEKVAGTGNFLEDKIDLSRLSELGFHCQAWFGMAPGLCQPDGILPFNTQRLNSYNSEKITANKPIAPRRTTVQISLKIDFLNFTYFCSFS